MTSLFAAVVILHLKSADSRAKVANFITNAAILTVTVLLLIMLLEIGLHLDPHLFIGDHEPDTVGEFSDFSSRGYLTKEVFKKPQGVFRILGLGDSFAVYAAPGNKNYHTLLQEKLDARGGGRFEIVNAGMPAEGPGYYRHILEKLGDRLKPDLVLVGYFMGNDTEEWEMMVRISHFIYEPKDLWKKLLGYRRFKNSRLGRLIESKYFWFRERRRMAQEVAHQGGKGQGTFSNESFLDMERKRSWIFQKSQWAELEREWRQCSRVILQMQHWCDDRNIPLVLAIFPEQFQVDESLRREIDQKYHIPVESLDLEQPNRLLTSFCELNRLRCLDLLPAFQQKGKSMPLYVSRDSHWNEAGNRLAAELIFKYLEEHNLIKAD